MQTGHQHKSSRYGIPDSNAVMQVAEIVEDSSKSAWLHSRLQQFIDAGDVLVFASTQARVDELSGQLQSKGIKYAPSRCPPG